MLDFLITNCQLVHPNGPIVRGDIGVLDGRIAYLGNSAERPEAREVRNADWQFLLPGVIDAHVHYGYVDPIDDYRVETASAAKGGITCTAEYYRQMRSYEDLHDKVSVIESRAHIDMAIHPVIMTEQHIREIPEYVDRFGITSFKCWMSRRELPPDRPALIQGFEEGELFETMEQVAAIPGGVLALHAENLEICQRFRPRADAAGLSHSLAGWHAARPPMAEGVDILKAGYLARHARCPIYIVHVGSKEAVSAIEQVREWGVTIYAETCPQYLTHTVDDPSGYLAKVNPPVREAEDVAAIWDAVRRGVFNVIGTDHAAKPLHEKHLDGTIWEAAPAFPASFTMLPVLLSEGVNKGRLTLPQLAELVSAAPARIFRLPGKGSLALGSDADLVLVDLEAERVVTPEDQGSVSTFSIYDGWTLKGWPALTMVRGRIVATNGEVVGPAGHGRYLRRR